jgi:hypothetical protein
MAVDDCKVAILIFYGRIGLITNEEAGLSFKVNEIRMATSHQSTSAALPP